MGGVGSCGLTFAPICYFSFQIVFVFIFVFVFVSLFVFVFVFVFVEGGIPVTRVSDMCGGRGDQKQTPVTLPPFLAVVTAMTRVTSVKSANDHLTQ